MFLLYETNNRSNGFSDGFILPGPDKQAVVQAKYMPHPKLADYFVLQIA
jgi:hypothetical protein